MNTLRQFTGLAYMPRSPLCRDLLYPTANMTYCDKAPASVTTVQVTFFLLYLDFFLILFSTDFFDNTILMI